MGKNEKKSFKKGDVLLSEKPFAFVLKGELNTERCDYCFKRNQLLKCTGCSFAHYCDRHCQKNGWTYHKFECSNIKRVAPRIVPDAARMLSRIIIKLHTGGAHEKSYYTETKFRVFRDLMSHYNEMKNDKKRIEHFISLNAVLHEYLEGPLIPNEAELLAIYGKMVVNTFNILDYEMRSIGSGMYLGASVVDHSCSPNAVAVFDGTKIFIRTLQDIDTLDWMKVYISYIELLNLPSVRQEELKSTYYFLCQCVRCMDIEEVNCMLSTICQNEVCKMPIQGGVLETTLECPNCKSIISEESKEEIRSVVKFSEEQFNKMGDVAYLDICRVCLKKQEKIFHSFNIYKVKILDLAMESCIELENWEAAFDYGKQLYAPLKKYYGELHPLRGIFLMKLGKIALLLNQVNEANTFFKEAASILFVTHGSQHVRVKEEPFMTGTYINRKWVPLVGDLLGQWLATDGQRATCDTLTTLLQLFHERLRNILPCIHEMSREYLTKLMLEAKKLRMLGTRNGAVILRLQGKKLRNCKDLTQKDEVLTV